LVIFIQMVSRSMKKIRTQHGIAVDFCYPDSEELSLICPECGINSVRIFPPEITDGDRGFRGIVVTIRCECENLHTFSVVFGQRKRITFVRTDLDFVVRKERSSFPSSLGQRGLKHLNTNGRQREFRIYCEDSGWLLGSNGGRGDSNIRLLYSAE
jgi:hypothetical protein